MVCFLVKHRSAKLNEVDIQSYRERLRKELEGFEKKLSRDRQRQEDKLHKKLTARKQRRMDEKVAHRLRRWTCSI